MEDKQKVYEAQVDGLMIEAEALSKQIHELFLDKNMFLCSLTIIAVIKAIKEDDSNAWDKALEWTKKIDRGEWR